MYNVNNMTRFYFKIVITLFAVISHSGLIRAAINADVHFDLIGEGFHRNLNYDIKFNGLNESDCAIAVHVLLPPEIYVNVDEIADLKRLGKALACSVGEIDVELFAERAKPQNVTMCEEMRSPREISLSLPVHQRYKFSREEGGYVSVDIPKPKLFVGCKNRLKSHRVSKIDLCSPCAELAIKWREIPYRLESVGKAWEIPVGNLSHLNKVSYVTLLITGIGAAVVLKVLFQLRRTFERRGIKED